MWGGRIHSAEEYVGRKSIGGQNNIRGERASGAEEYSGGGRISGAEEYLGRKTT